MKNISTYLSLLSLILVGVLFYFHFTKEKPQQARPKATVTDNKGQSFRMAYFDIDSLQSRYEYFKDVSEQIKTKESSISSQLNSLQETYQRRMKELQDKAPTMTQAEGESAQREFAQMQQKYQQRQVTMEQDLKKHQMEMMTTVRTRIENYLKEYNKEKGYAFILSYEPGFMLYYKDSVYDITDDVIEGLNSQYKQDKK